ncbi:MAG: sialate O-acetylesterase [Microbacterium gubbeenense]|uniref:sialate O-acetylesterase n=1 Tax=Microbacterium gubbeenense TaxID=159896 RepID=UPI003F995CC4
MGGVTPHGIRYPDGASKAKNLGPELKLMAEDIDWYIGSYLTPTGPIRQIIIGVAEEVIPPLVAPAVNEALEDRGIREGLDDTFRVLDRAGQIALEVDRYGTVIAHGPTELAGVSTIGGARVDRGIDNRFRIRDLSHRIALQVEEDGRVFIPHLRVSSLQGDSSGGGASVTRVVMLLLMGQSNAEGRGLPIIPFLDEPHPRILMTQWDGDTVEGIVPATVPLSSQRAQVGLSIGTVIAREIVAEREDTAVVIVNAAVGGVPLVNSGGPDGTWNPDYTGENPHLLDIALDAWEEARDLAAAKYGVTPTTVMAWHQGEADGGAGTGKVSYETAFDQLVTVARSRIGSSAAPIVLGGIVPGHGGESYRDRIVAAHEATPGRVLYSAYAPGPAGGGGSQATSDGVHYHRGGVEVLGRRMWDGLKRAFGNSAASVPHTPPSVSATRADGTLTVTWDFPGTRADSFLPEYRVDGGTWSPVGGMLTPTSTSAQKAGVTGGLVEVRVASTNSTQTSAYSIPVPAIGA